MNSHLRSIDLRRLLNELIACAARWFIEEHCFNADDMLPATGQSAVDLAYGIVAQFVAGDIAIRNNKPSHEDIFRVLRQSMRHDFLDLMKTGRAYKRTEIYIDNAEPGQEVESQATSLRTIDQLGSIAESGFDDLELFAIEKRVKDAIGDDPPLNEFVDAILHGKCTKREDIAEYLGVTPQEVTNRQRRLRDRLAEWRQSTRPAAKGAR
jgi:hypothetical protein